jgi:malonyl-CoA O-methyltransferase
MSDSRPVALAIDPAAVQRNWRRQATAAQAPWLHQEVARRMAERLDIVRLRPELVINWHGQVGGSADLLRHAYPQSRRVVLEPTTELAQRSLAAAARPWWSVRRWREPPEDAVGAVAELPGGAGLVWANMGLHAATDPLAVMAEWHGALHVDGFVMFSTFGPDTLRELRDLYRRLGWGAPAQGFVDMHDLGDMLVQTGFADPVMDQEQLRLQWDSPAELLQELRALGGNAAPDRQPGLRTPRWRERLLAELEGLRGPQGKLQLTFEIAYGHAFKAPPRLKPGQETVVSLHDMRSMVRQRRPPG